jgi:hypothetical protein
MLLSADAKTLPTATGTSTTEPEAVTTRYRKNPLEAGHGTMA